MSAFFPLPRCGMGEGSHVIKSARGFLQFIKVEHVAVHKKSQNNVSMAHPFYQNPLNPDTWWFRSRTRIKIKNQVFKISKQRAYFDCIWLTPIGQAEPRDKAISQDIDWVSDLNNFRRNPFLIKEIIQKGCLAVVCFNTELFKCRNSPGDDCSQSQSDEPYLPSKHCACVHDKRALPMRMRKSAAFFSSTR